MAVKEFGPPQEIIQTIFNFHPDALEELAAWIEQRGLRTPISNVLGFQQFTGQPASDVAALESTSSTSYGDLASLGPSLTLGDGKYFVWFGCRMFGESTLANGFMSISVNGSTPSDNDGLESGGPDDDLSANPPTTAMRGIAVTLSNGTNTIVAKYRSAKAGTNASFQNRWMFALRYSDIR